MLKKGRYDNPFQHLTCLFLSYLFNSFKYAVTADNIYELCTYILVYSQAFHIILLIL